MSCIRLPVSPAAASAASFAARLPWTTPEARETKAERALALSYSPIVQIAAAGANNPWLPVWRMHEIKTSPENEVRGWLLRNVRAPKEIIEFLTSDPDPSIAAFARSLLLP